MNSEQPLKKKLRREGEIENQDETDFIHNLAENNVPTNFQALHLSLPSDINEDDLTRNQVNLQLQKYEFQRSGSDIDKSEETATVYGNFDSYCNNIHTRHSSSSISEYISIDPAPNIKACSSSPSKDADHPIIVQSSSSGSNIMLAPPTLNSHSICTTTHERCLFDQQKSDIITKDQFGLDEFQNQLIRQCLCGVSDEALRKPFHEPSNDNEGRSIMLSEWSNRKILEFLSNLQLLFDVYLKQNNKGFICSRIVDVCESIICNEYNLIEQIISLCETRNKFVTYLAARVLSSFLIIAKTNINNEWLETLVNFFTTENLNYIKMQFAIEIFKRVVEWKDVEIHVLEDRESQETPGTSFQQREGNYHCITVPFSDSESYDTSSIKDLVIKSLESKWPELIYKVQNLILHNSSLPAQTCTLTFLSLWESIISVKANLSVIEIKPFYAHLEIFVGMLNNNLTPIIWKQLLSLFNEVLCYGSTLALQDMLPDETCQLAHLIVRYVKDYRLLDSIPVRRPEGVTVNSFAGSVINIHGSSLSQMIIDKTLLQKMVLLVLKSVAITIKETRSDSSDSSVGSDDSDFYHDMQVIERSIRDVLRKVEAFLKNGLEFHPETPFSRILVQIFSDQDDYMIEAMVCTLDLTTGMSYRNALFPDLINMLNPFHSFIEFLTIVSHDPDLLLDYLVSNETCFLLYLLRFLKYTKRNWSRFISSCGEGNTSRSNELDDAMSVLIRLKLQIIRLVDKDLFPYNITPILRLLEICESLYEGNELS